MVEYEKIKKSIAGLTNHKDVESILLSTIEHRDQLNEIIELVLDKQAALSAKSIEKY